jgi:hypothetical protein
MECLPKELVHLIAKLCAHPYTWSRLRLVCRKWRDIVDKDDSAWVGWLRQYGLCKDTSPFEHEDWYNPFKLWREEVMLRDAQGYYLCLSFDDTFGIVGAARVEVEEFDDLHDVEESFLVDLMSRVHYVRIERWYHCIVPQFLKVTSHFRIGASCEISSKPFDETEGGYVFWYIENFHLRFWGHL